MRGMAVLENHADRNACIDKADRGDTSRRVCAEKCVNVCRDGMRGMSTQWEVCVCFFLLCIYAEKNA